MDLTTSYLGMQLKNPLVVSACPLSREVSSVRALEDAGAAAIVVFSLFEEEITHETMEPDHHLNQGTHIYAEALNYFPEHAAYDIDPEAYLDHLYRLQKAVDIPIIGSLNGASPGGWVEYARNIEATGVDALELNIYHIPTDTSERGETVERMHLDILKEIKQQLQIPVAVKLSPYFSSMAHMAKQLDGAGADALVLFNRFYQPDINLENLEVYPHVLLSSEQDLHLPMRWIAILYDHLRCDLAATSGIHSAEDALKMLMVGADVTMMASALLKHGIGHLARVLQDLGIWLQNHEYDSVLQLRGSMSQRRYADPEAFERANYIKALNTF